MRYLHICILIFCVWISTFAQNNSLSFYSKNTQDGLSNNWVRCVYQDARGFMWFGTASGLNRYDGVNFKHYPLNYANINAIITKDTEHMLICTDLGAYLYNIYNHEFSDFDIQADYPILSVAKDNNGLLWFATSGGLVRYSEHDSVAQLYTYSEHNTSTISNNYCNTVIVDDAGTVWVGTKNGLNRFNASTNTFSRYQMHNTPDLQSNDILALAVDYKQRLWVGAARGGVSVFSNPLSETLTGTRVFQGNAIALCIDSKNNLWIGRGSGEGLQVINLKDYTSENIPTPIQYKKSVLQKHSLSDNSIFHIYEDSMGDIWIGTFGGGVNYTSKRIKNFHIIEEYYGANKILSSNLINCFYQDSHTLWIGTESGLDEWNMQTNTFRSYMNIPGNSTSLQGNAVYAIHKDSQGTLWVGTWGGGLNKFNYDTKTFTHIPLSANPVNNVFSIAEDAHKNLWIGTIEPTDGLFTYNLQTGAISRYSTKRADTSSISENSVNDILVTQNGSVFVSTFRSVELYQPHSNNFLRIPLHNFSSDTITRPYISSLFEDAHGRVLVGTNYGVLELDTVQKKIVRNQLFKNFTTTIQGITEDANNNIWISTQQGIKRFIADTSTNKPYVVEHFTYHDGISADETKPRSIYRNSKGYIFVGTSQGITFFHEDSIYMNTNIPRVEITDMLLLNFSPNENAEYIPITNTSFFNDTIVLKHTATDFIIRYAALNYLVPQKNRYFYKLVGHNSEWIDAGTQTSVTYTNMQPGTYVFQVIGSNNDGVWNTEPAKLTIVIKYPWWQTIYFKIVLVLLVILGIWGVIKFRVAIYKAQQIKLTQKVEERTQELSQTNKVLQTKQEQISRQNKELFRHRNELQNLVEERTADLLIAKQKAEESDRLKSAFLSNMSHEIRTPMNAIVGFSEMLVQDELTEDEKVEFVRIISESSKQLLRIVDDILDISRIETGSMSITTEVVDLHAVMAELRDFFEPQMRSKGIQFIQDIPSQAVVLETDRTKLFQIFTNLIGNALKFTRSGEVCCGYVVQENQIQFFVKDTGVGIPKRLHEKIFERFRQADLKVSRTHGGTGLGLAICKRLVELMSGTIWLESEINIGSSFYFTLPYVQAEIQEKPKFKSRFSFVSKTKKTILVAEDNDINYLYLYKVLTRANYTVIRAKNGSEAVHICEENPDIAMVLMDIRMPVLDGIEAAKLILQQKPNLPILMQTAFALTVHNEQIKQINCIGMISKPIKRDELLRYISEHI